MKRKSAKKRLQLLNKDLTAIDAKFFSSTTSIEYNEQSHERKTYEQIEDINIIQADKVHWLNIYGFQKPEAIRRIVSQNKLDEFIPNLATQEDHRNKVIELNNCFFLSIKALQFSSETLKDEQLIFICAPYYIWSIQETVGDHFNHIRTRIEENKGIVRKKKADYLLYLMIDALIDNYYAVYEDLLEKSIKNEDFTKVKPDPDYMSKVEASKRQFFQLKKALSSLREAINQIINVDLANFNTKYFSELKEQVNFMIDDIDFNLQQLESSINLIFTIQSHRLNEVMRTLTIFSVIFIPLTFLAGIYGMNFSFMPELQYKYGYFIILGVMLSLFLGTLYYIKKEDWFS